MADVAHVIDVTEPRPTDKTGIMTQLADTDGEARGVTRPGIRSKMVRLMSGLAILAVAVTGSIAGQASDPAFANAMVSENIILGRVCSLLTVLGLEDREAMSAVDAVRAAYDAGYVGRVRVEARIAELEDGAAHYPGSQRAEA